MIFFSVSYPIEQLPQIKFGYSEKATKFEKIFHLEFDTAQ